MKKIISIISILMVIFCLVACKETQDYSNQTLVGKVTAIDGNKVSLKLGSLEEIQMGNNDFPNQGQQMPGNNNQGMNMENPPEMPDNQGMNMENPPEIPNNQQGQNPMDMQNGTGLQMSMYSFVEGEETASFDLKNIAITSDNPNQQEIAVGDVLELVIGNKNKIESATIKSVIFEMDFNAPNSFDGSN